MKPYYQMTKFYALFLLAFCVFSWQKCTAQLLYPKVEQISFPIGQDTQYSPKRDGDGWYVARRFGSMGHLGDDWNAESGGNSDCGEKVFAAAAGVVVHSQDMSGGWGNVIIVRHLLPDGKLVETLYGHLEIRLKEIGELVGYREQIGRIGDGGGDCGDSAPYAAHLHFEVREQACRNFGEVGGGYDSDFAGWLDPLIFLTE